MAPTHGKDTSFKIEDSVGSTLRDISAQCTSVTFSRQNDNHDTTCFGAEGHTFINGLTNGTIQVQGWWDSTASTGTATVIDSLVGLDGTTLSWEYGPFGTTTGFVKYTGESVLKSVDVSTPVADLVSFTMQVQISGDVTKGTF
jgi:hypothetical protein